MISGEKPINTSVFNRQPPSVINMLITEGEKLSIIDISTVLSLNTSQKMRHKMAGQSFLIHIITAPAIQRQNNLHPSWIICYLRQRPAALPVQGCASSWPFSFWPFQVRRCYPYRPLNLYDPFPFWRNQFIWKCSMTVCTRLYFHHRITITKCKK